MRFTGPCGPVMESEPANAYVGRPTAISRRPHRSGGLGRVPPQLEDLIAREKVQEVRRALLALPERTALIVAMRFGIGPDDEGERSMQEIGDELGLSRERIRQIMRDWIAALQVALRTAA